MSDAAGRLLDKLRDFAAGLEDEERALLAALVAPAVAAAYEEEPEVEGFAWRTGALPDHLAETIRSRELHVEGW